MQPDTPLRISARAALRSLLLKTACLALICSIGYGQRLFVESDTVEGQLLQQIDAEQDARKRVALLEKFASDFPNHEAVTWVLSHLQTTALQAKDYDRVLEITTRILAVDPEDIAAAHNALRAVEGKKDPELVRRWSVQTSTIARRVINAKPRDDQDADERKAVLDFAKQVELYSEYSLYFAALTAEDPAAKNALVGTLEARNPQSEYLVQLRTMEAVTAQPMDADEAVRVAEAGFEKDQWNVDQLFMVAAYYMQQRTNPEKVVSYGVKLLELIENAPKPVDLSDEKWGARKCEIAGQTNWMVGLIFSTQEKYSLADQYLRAALKDIKNQDMIAGALYHLGFVNYRIAESGDRIRIHDAVKFTSDCARIPSAVQAQAAENLRSMKSEYALPDEMLPRD